MTEKPLVSVFIIFFNGEKYLEEAIESVLKQTYDHWELLLVDDGSVDSSAKIARSYEYKYPGKIKYLHHPNHKNKGISATRNLGIRDSKGKYVAMLDSDDVWLPEKLEEQIAILEAHPEVEMIYGRTQVWFSWSGKPEDQDKDYTLELGVEPDQVIAPPRLVPLLLECKVQSPTTCNVVFRKSIFEKCGYFVENFRGMYEDFAYFTKVCLKSSVYISSKTWAKYRQHSESCCFLSEESGKSWKDRYPVLEWIEGYFKEEKVKDRTLLKALNKQLFPYRHENLFLLKKDPIKLFRRYQKKGIKKIIRTLSRITGTK